MQIQDSEEKKICSQSQKEEKVLTKKTVPQFHIYSNWTGIFYEENHWRAKIFAPAV